MQLLSVSHTARSTSSGNRVGVRLRERGRARRCVRRGARRSRCEWPGLQARDPHTLRPLPNLPAARPAPRRSAARLVGGAAQDHGGDLAQAAVLLQDQALGAANLPHRQLASEAQLVRLRRLQLDQRGGACGERRGSRAQQGGPQLSEQGRGACSVTSAVAPAVGGGAARQRLQRAAHPGADASCKQRRQALCTDARSRQARGQRAGRRRRPPLQARRCAIHATGGQLRPNPARRQAPGATTQQRNRGRGAAPCMRAARAVVPAHRWRGRSGAARTWRGS